jgi:hypothetical protein
LIRSGLIEKYGNDGSFAIHRLVQATTLHFVDEEARNSIFNAVIDLFAEGHPQSQATSDTLFDHWALCALYSPHIQRFQVLIKEWKFRPESTEKLWIIFFNCSRFVNIYRSSHLILLTFHRYLLETGSMAKALVLVEAAEELCDLDTEQGELQITYLYNARGIIALQHQQVVEGRAWFERTYDIRKRYLGVNNVNTAAVEGNLSLTLLTERRWEDLISFNNTRRQNFESRSITNIPARLSFAIYNLLALAYLETSQLDGAWENICKATNMISGEAPVFSQLNA